MDKIKVSILVPAYNVEAYIDGCLQSLISQTFKEIEIVVVDDGSTDQTATITEQYAATDPRIHVVRLQEHQGVSYARNICLAQAQGEYLAFVDSDDYISTTAIQDLYNRASQSQADIVLGSILYCYSDGKKIRIGDKSSVFHSDNDIVSGQECFIQMQKTGCYVPMVCGNLYRTDFIKAHLQLHFEGTFHEDEYFTPFALYKAERVTDYKPDFYFYRQHPKSIMHRNEHIEQRIEALQFIINRQTTFASKSTNSDFKEALLKNVSRLSKNVLNLQGGPSIDKNRKQLLIFTRKNCASRYGIGTYIKQLAASLDLSVWDVHIMELYASDTECSLSLKNGIHYIHFPNTSTNRNDADEIYQKSVFYWIVTHYPSDNLYCHFNYTADRTLATLLKEKLNAHIFFTLHYMGWKFYLDGKDERNLQRILTCPQTKREKELVSCYQQENDFLHQCCDKIITVSQHSYEMLQSIYNIEKSRITYIPHGLLDTYRKRNKQELKNLRDKYHLSIKDKVILYIGRLSEDKGLHLLIAVFKLLQEQHDDIRLIIAGGGDYEHFINIANPYWNKIIFTGYLSQEQLEELYAISTIGVIPSFHEELGYVAIEMLMYRLPIVCSDASGLKEVTDNGKYAAMISNWCDSNRLFLLKEALDTILSDIQCQETLKEKGRTRFLKEYVQTVYKKRIKRFYQ